MKTNRMGAKLLAFVLAALLLLSQVSCASSPKEAESNTQRLEVETVPAVYSESLRTAVTEKIADLIERVVRLYEGLVLTETQRQSLRLRIEQAVLPALQSVPFYKQELEHLLRMAEEMVSAAEGGEPSDPSRIAVLLRFYQSGLGYVNSAKLGALLYHALLCGLDLLIEVNEARYNQYGYEWYLQDAQAYRAQRMALEQELGVDAFCEVSAMLLFAGSLVSNAWSLEDSRLFAVSDAELVMLLQKQGDHFAASEVTARQWSVAADLWCEWVAVDGESALSLTLQAMRESGDVASAAAAIPAFFVYYRAFTHALDELYLNAMLSSNKSARVSAWVSVLVECEGAFLALDAVLAAQLRESDGVLEALQRAGLGEELEAFLADTPTATAADVTACLRACANSYRPEQIEALETTFLAYLRTYLPCLTFAMLYDRSEKGDFLC